MTNRFIGKIDSLWHRFKVLLIVAPTLSIILATPYPAPLRNFFFNMPEPSATFDCDDSALLMVQRFEAIGIKATPVLGNLKMNNETYSESDHVWVLAEIAGLRLAFDWGTPHFDKQHYEGYTLSDK